ncbi:unnamed protein product, partial [Discosporangium mesarthrocarpum]
LKIRDEPDSCSMDTGALETGSIVKVVEVSGLWVRVAYHGQEDGWVLTANKRGPMLVPEPRADVAESAWEEQEAQHTAAVAAAAADSATKPVSAEDLPIKTNGDSEVEGGRQGEGGDVPMGGGNDGPLPRGMGRQAEASTGITTGGFMGAMGSLKIREEPDPFSPETGKLEMGSIVKVLESSALWVRVAYHGREDGWVLTVNKIGPMLVPEPRADVAESAWEEQEAQHAAAMAAAAAASASKSVLAEDVPIRTSNGPEAEAGEGALPVSDGDSRPLSGAAGGGANCSRASVGGFMGAMGPLKVREEADPFSGDIGALEMGSIVKVLEVSGLWVRVAYHGREDGWVLTANKRGPMLVPEPRADVAESAWEEQEAQHAATIAGAAVDSATKPVSAEDLPLRTSNNSEAEEEGLSGAGTEDRALPGAGTGGPKSSGAAMGGFMGAMGGLHQGGIAEGSGQCPRLVLAPPFFFFLCGASPLKIREEADPFSRDVGALETGSIVKVLEASGLWVRVAYHGREDGWVLTANKLGPMLVPEPRADVAESVWEEQEAQHAAAVAAAAADSATKPVMAEDLPLRTSNGSEAEEGGPPMANAEDMALSGRGVNGGRSPRTAIGGFMGMCGARDGHNPPCSLVPNALSPLFLFLSNILSVREEADPFSGNIGALETGSIVKVLEVSGLWVRVGYHGREDGWVLTTNKLGPMLVPEPRADVAENAWEEQEAQHAAAIAGAAADSATKPVMAEDIPIRTTKDSLAEEGEGVLVEPTTVREQRECGSWGWRGGGWIHGGNGVRQNSKTCGVARNLCSAPATMGFALGLYPLKIREEADPFSAETGALETGSVVKVLEVSGLWVRVAYHGREDGWVLTANKRGPMLVPEPRADVAESAWEDQEAQHAAIAAAALNSATKSVSAEDLPLRTNKNNLEAQVSEGSFMGAMGLLPSTQQCSSSGDDPHSAFLGTSPLLDLSKAIRPIDFSVFPFPHDAFVGVVFSSSTQSLWPYSPLKIHEEADPFSADVGVLETGAVVKVLVVSGLWVRVAYHGREDGWVLTANKLGPMLVPEPRADVAESVWEEQEAQHAAAVAADGMGQGKKEAGVDRPLAGQKSSNRLSHKPGDEGGRGMPNVSGRAGAGAGAGAG